MLACAARSSSPIGPAPAGRRPSSGALFSAIALSGAASMVAVRLATPLTIDERLTAVALFFVIPGLIVLAVGALNRATGLVLAALQPFLWVALVRGDGDTAALWAIPVVSAVIIALAAPGSAGRRRTAGVLAVASLCVALLFPAAGQPADGTRAVLIGVDGASWQCVDATIAAGRMPNVERMLAGGHRARLRSLPSMLSPQVWSAMATGCSPSVNGIHGWAQSQRDFRVGRVWDKMLADGRSYGVCGWYFTWPPPEGLSGRCFVVPSTLAPDNQAFPKDCRFFWDLWAAESGLRDCDTPYPLIAIRALRNGVRLSTLRRAVALLLAGRSEGALPLDTVWRSRKISAAVETDMFCELLRSRRPELGVILLNQVDKVSHLYWKYREPEALPEEVDPAAAERYGGAIEELYAEADRSIGKIVGAIPSNANVVVVSDHGFQPFLRRNMSEFCRIRTEALIGALGLRDAVLGSNLDSWAFIEPRPEVGAEAGELLSALAKTLGEVHLKGETIPLFEVVVEDALIKLEIAARDAVAEDATIVLDGNEYPLGALVSARQEALFSGRHAIEGVYIMAGPRAAEARATDELTILDVAPTLAALLNLPMSPDWTGRPAIEEQALADVEPIRYPPPSLLAASPAAPAGERLKETLRSLGYLE